MPDAMITNPPSEDTGSGGPLPSTDALKENAREGVTPLDWKTLVESVDSESFEPGVELFRQGDAVQRVYLLERGLIKITHCNSSNDVKIMKLMSAPGHILGAPCAVMRTHFVTYTTLTAATLKAIPAERFRQALQTDTSISWQLHQMHCRELYEQTNHEALQGNRSIRQRVEDFIWQIIEANGYSPTQRDLWIELPMKYAEIARMCMSSPEHLSRIIKQMRKEGLIQSRKHHLFIPDPARLWHDEHNSVG